MKPFFLQYKSLTITWYALFLFLALVVSYGVFKISIRKLDKEKKKKLDDMFFYVALVGFIGSRLTYVLFNYGSFQGKLIAIIKPSQYNLYLSGGIIFGLGSLYLLSKKYDIDFLKSFNRLVTSFYIAMAIGVWHFKFNMLLSPVRAIKFGNLYLSLLFILGLIISSFVTKKLKNNYLNFVVLALVLFIYNII